MGAQIRTNDVNAIALEPTLAELHFRTPQLLPHRITDYSFEFCFQEELFLFTKTHRF